MPAPNGGRDRALVEMRDGMNRLRGRLFGVVDAVGFEPKREEAIKRLIRQSTYDVQADLEAALRENA